MPKEPKPMPPFPAVGGEFEWNGTEFVRRSTVTAPGCEADLKASAAVEGATVSTPEP
jgi:hypothetical protein